MKITGDQLARLGTVAFLCWAMPAYCQDAKPGSSGSRQAAASYVPFEGKSSKWHGFVRYDFVMDDDTLGIAPSEQPQSEGDGIGNPAAGQHRCVVVVPAVPARGNPWSWRGCYWDHQPQTEIELLKRGFHIAYISASATLRPGKPWDAWYDFLTQKHGLSQKPAFVGMSRGGEFAYTWAVAHPDKVACIYADNPGGNDDVLARLGLLARQDVPLLHVCGSVDPILNKFTLPIEAIYQQFGGRISVMIKEGRGHHPHSLRDPKPIADFIEQSVSETKREPPAFLAAVSARQYYYSKDNQYTFFPSEGTYVTCRGPFFTPCYERYEMTVPDVEAFSKVIVPNTPAPGNPWIFRADVPQPNAVDLALLARGCYIVTGAMPFNHDDLVVEQWNRVYQHLVQAGLSSKPVVEGDGGAAGEVLTWVVSNPDKVSCVYFVNPSLHSSTAGARLLDNLAPLARAGVPLVSVCGDRDPCLDDTRELERRYKAAGGNVQVIIRAGASHFPLAPDDPAPVVAFLVKGANLHP
ncbi:MAG TPA: alpha/beta hydrolase [Verrucomicrobiae bacterium]|nr:alpha/beta hydrolase [Verrucomicrobiae bacterium]